MAFGVAHPSLNRRLAGFVDAWRSPGRRRRSLEATTVKGASLDNRARVDPQLRHRLRSAVECRHEALGDTAGHNEEVFDALVVLAAVSWEPD